MGNYWVDDMFDVLSAADVPVGVNSINSGWERRSRSSGGFDGAPLGCQWHHTASSASVDSDLNYMINGSPDEPVGNVLVDRAGIWWPIAAGAANTSGKGGPSSFSRGVCPLDSGNTRLFSIEIANNGVGEFYNQAQIDSCFRGSNALNTHFGNQPTDVITHALGAGDGYTDRKIDPATAHTVQGNWRPASVNSSGTWSLTDLRTECLRRATTQPTPPEPTPIPKDDDMPLAFVATTAGRAPILVTIDGAGHSITPFLSDADRAAIVGALADVNTVQVTAAQFDEFYRIAGAGDTS